MSVHILDAMSREGFEEVLAFHDGPSGLRGFLAIHDTSAGPAFGGLRRFEYANERAALLDCLRLARAMTHKCALAGLPAGGGKLVLFDREGARLPALYARVGELIERQAGRFQAGPDVGTSARELAWVAQHTRYVTQPDPEGAGALAEATAAGVFGGMAAALRQLDGAESWSERTIVIQGLGEVGCALAQRLVAAGARVLATDLDGERLARLARELGLEPLADSSEFDQPCDVFAPCAMGGILHDLSLKRLRARIVAGAANNQLARAAHGQRLHAQGILYVPDFVLNAGALIRGALYQLEGRSEPLAAIEARIGTSCAAVLAEAAEARQAPQRVALRRAEAVLAQRRSARKAERG